MPIPQAQSLEIIQWPKNRNRKDLGVFPFIRINQNPNNLLVLFQFEK